MLTVPLRCTRAPSLKTVTADRSAASSIRTILPHGRYCPLRLTQPPFARRRARVICGAVASV